MKISEEAKKKLLEIRKDELKKKKQYDELLPYLHKRVCPSCAGVLYTDRYRASYYTCESCYFTYDNYRYKILTISEVKILKEQEAKKREANIIKPKWWEFWK